jgi:hypothetical protein
MFQTELCQCGKLKQTSRSCKSCGLTIHTQPQEYAEGGYELPMVVAKAMPVIGEDDIERARR